MFRVISTVLLAVLAFALRKVGTHAPLPVEPPPADRTDPESRRSGHEVSEPAPAAIAAVAVGLFLTIIVSMAVLGWMYVHLYSRREAMPAPLGETRFPHAIEAKSSIADDWTVINRQAHDRLETYGWVSQADGVARIPIERAMQVIVSEGLPARESKTPDFPAPSDEKRPLIETEGGNHVEKAY
jgi:hypothetical protein